VEEVTFVFGSQDFNTVLAKFLPLTTSDQKCALTLVGPGCSLCTPK